MPFPRTKAIAKIHVVAKQKGLDKDTLYSVAATVLGKPTDGFSLKACTDSQLATLCEHLNSKNPVPTGPIPVADSASHKQVWKINQLAGQLGMDADRLAGFIERQTRRRADPKQLRFFEASKVIEGLKNLVKNPNNLA